MLELLADSVLLLHLAVVVFVVGGLGFIVLGNVMRWNAANAPLFRWVHLFAIMVVVVQSWLGVECPLTTFENWLRSRAGRSVYEVSFVQHWVSAVLYYQAPAWVFATKRVTLHFLDQQVAWLDPFSVLLLPMQVVFPCVIGERQVQSASSRGR
jgi:hypothetical protein